MARTANPDPYAATVPPVVVRIPRQRAPRPAVPVLYVCGCGKARGSADTQEAATLAVRLHRAATDCTQRARLIGLAKGWQ